jgi:hypothetical protein
MNLAIAEKTDTADVLAEAFGNAGKLLGLTQADLGQIIGKDRTAVSRRRIDPTSKDGELALLFIRCFRALSVLVGGEQDSMRHWMHTENLHTGGVPAQQVKSVQGLVKVLSYLDGIRGKL